MPLRLLVKLLEVLRKIRVSNFNYVRLVQFDNGELWLLRSTHEGDLVKHRKITQLIEGESLVVREQITEAVS